MHTRSQRIIPSLLLGFIAIFLAGCSDGNLFELVNNFWALGCCGTVVVILDILALIDLAGGRKTTGTKVLWALFIIFFPVLGLICYYLFGRE